MFIKKQINQNLVSLIFFVLLYLLGLNIFKDYGIYLDDEYQRNNAFFWYNYLKSIALNLGMSPTLILDSLINNKIQIINSSTIPSLQPTPLGIFCEFFIDIFNYEDSQRIYQSRHLYNFTIFFIGLFFFKKLIYVRFKSHLYSFLGVFFLLLSPRFFAESFYNSQDIYFLTLTIINMYTGVKFLKNPSNINIFLFSLSSALAFDTRIMAVLSISIIIIFFFLKSLRSKIFFQKNIKFLLQFTLYISIFVYIFWPYLWTDPISNFLFAFSELFSAKFDVTNFYLGKYISSTFIPWHYHIVWASVTTPLIVIFLFIIGLIYSIRRLFTRLMKINDDLNDLWRGDNEMLDIYFFAMIFLSILIFINKGLGYTGWRHLYFVYPSIILISLNAFHYIHKINKIKFIKFLTYSLIATNLFYLSLWSFKFHPFQNVYFNLLNKKDFNNLFEMDYWGLSNKVSLEYIAQLNLPFPVKVATKSFSSLEKSILILSDYEKSKIKITHNLEEADFIITNYMKRIRRDFLIDKKNYKKVFEVLVDQKPINTVYKKIN